MKVTLVLCSSLALCLACPDVVPVDCGVDMMSCPVVSSNGCPMPDSCLPMKGGPVGNDGNECAVTCPMDCGKDMMNCPGFNDANGCKMPDTCMPTKGGAVDNDGNDCPVSCPCP